ncbi:MAG: hypothetical protein N2508_08365 [Anaerolineae bacterium]|nr:hypothetical protein [Anaerolineae bacterium]
MSAKGLGKFIDPHGWDAQWVVSDEMVFLAVEEEPETVQENHVCAKFYEPRSWALKWDGYALYEADAQALLLRS